MFVPLNANPVLRYSFFIQQVLSDPGIVADVSLVLANIHKLAKMVPIVTDTNVTVQMNLQ
jgi:hypothetical protein